ncbi:cytochrome c biogenesis CcdA family protein [Clostridium lacusfryxellense]|uniref:cytochrome c biogenesis CcdA family protein n=1 Tax=Clostridium lacusfryxellense TaxID=205328 RepID=UPI001C0E2E88|nr:cytochrome c biogenesis CcdA family protein [Clostridium lacusfryxellense]MBU3114264.1 cytochrome c biogenesis CcdA family protein [Clostridium lacusfryxellense]
MLTNQIFMSTVFVAGIFSFFSPCLVPLLPVYISIFAGDQNNRNQDKYIKKLGRLNINLIVIAKTLVFVGGISTSFIILGFGAGSLGTLINSKLFITFCGLIVIILGIHQTGLVHLKGLDRERRLILRSDNGILGIFLLGFSFSFGWTPCIGPILAAVLGISATGGQALYGVWLMIIYSLGLMIPFLIIAIFSDGLLRHVKKLNKHLDKIKIAGGIIIILMGILLMNNNLNLITKLFE